MMCDYHILKITRILSVDKCLWKFHSLKNHLQLIFDRAFGTSQQQWSIDTLKYQIQFLAEILNSMKEQDFDGTPSTPVNTMDEPFIRIVSLISRMKREFVDYSSSSSSSSFVSTHWSNNENNRWSGHFQSVQNDDLLNIGEDQLHVKIEVNRLENEHELQVSVSVKMNESTMVELPIGDWQENEIDTIVEMFIRELISFHHLLLE